MNVSLAGKVAVVTGGGSGIGLAVVRRFLECGAAGVVAVDRRPDLSEALGELDGSGRLATVVGDVAAGATAEAFTRAALDGFGRLDVLVNNAGVACVKPLHEHTEADWDTVLNTNVKAIFWAAKHVIPVMLRQGGGVILNTGSISGEVGLLKQGAYAASKGAVHQMTRQMAVEYAPHNVRVIAVGCGTVDTPLVHRSAAMSGDPPAFWERLKGGHPIGRVATAEEVADWYAFLASDRAAFCTGSVIMLDGGYTAR